MTEAPVALVTGANKGLGKETARQLAHRGMTVLVGSRDPDRGRRVTDDLARDGAVVTPLALDVTDPATVAAAADRIEREYGRLDVLVNNAGATVVVPAVELTAAQMREVYEVNVFGVVTVTTTMLGLLRAAPEPRIVNVSSTTASLTLSSQGTDFGGNVDQRLSYSSSKAALNMLTVQYAQAFAVDPTLAHLTVNSVTPGFTATDLNGHTGTRSVDEGARVIVDLATSRRSGTGGFVNDEGRVPW